jgi:hypothetical protein
MRNLTSSIVSAALIVGAAGTTCTCSNYKVSAIEEQDQAVDTDVEASHSNRIGREMVVDWNRIARQMQPNANVIVPHSRMFAIIHIGMHDGINSVQKRYHTWSPPIPSSNNSKKAASAAGVQAAYELATLLVPQTNRPPVTTYDPNGNPILPFGKDHLQNIINAQYAAHMNAIPAGPNKTAGIEIGKRVAAQVWHLRSSDKAIPPGQTSAAAFYGGAPKSSTFLANWWTPYMEQQQTPPLGVWRQHPADSGSPCVEGSYPVPFPAFNWWDTVTPFAMSSADQFIATAPPAPNELDPTLDLSANCRRDPSRKFACQMEQVRAIGAGNSTVRTADQEQAARWWGTCNDAFAFSLFTQEIARQKRLDLAETARAFALTSIATADAFILQKSNKNRWNYWRPISAIRELAQPDWCPLLPTPPDQEYIAGHPTVTAAALSTLQRLFGAGKFRQPIVLASQDTSPLCVGSAGAPPTRTFHSLEQAIEEVVMARVWGGMHYEVSGRAGVKLGRQLGSWVYSTQLTPSRWDDKAGLLNGMHLRSQ